LSISQKGITFPFFLWARVETEMYFFIMRVFMLTRMVLALKDSKLQQQLEDKITIADIEVECLGQHPEVWQQVVQSCADIIIISDSLIPQPVDAGITMLGELPESPTTVILHDTNSAELQAGYIAAGAHGALFSGVSEQRLISALEATVETRRQVMQHDRHDRRGKAKPKISDLTSSSETMQIFMNEVVQVASSDSLLMIMGETGVGKEHLAKVIHSESPRTAGPFVAVNTAALPEQLLESELFGHKQGAFTGATRSRRGAFEQAHGGTIFLDEIGEMPLHLQAKLLRVLQEYEIRPIGAEKPSWVDVRVIAATNRDLEDEVARGNFRKDLYYRLSVVQLNIPPLRMRREDIPNLSRRFVMDFKRKIGRDVRQISESAMIALCRYDWPGNIRELMNVIERSMLLCRTGEITIENLPSVIHNGLPDISLQEEMRPVSESWHGKTLAEVLGRLQQETEKKYLRMVLKQTKGRVKEAAECAGITSRSLYSKMKMYNLQKETFKTGK
jgi:DNA-binding NtrC family response regulator